MVSLPRRFILGFSFSQSLAAHPPPPLRQDEYGQIRNAGSIAAGLRYPAVGPEHSWLKDSGRAHYKTITDIEAAEAMRILIKTEGILAALEPAHALSYGIKVRMLPI